MKRIDAVIASVRAAIAARTYLPGMRLPSVRAQATAMQLSVSTVLEAYARLAAEGVLQSRPGAGFYVVGPVAPLALAALAPARDRDVDPLWVARQSLETDPGLLKPGCGWLPASWMPEAAMRGALRAQARADAPELADYATPLGHAPLREFLSRRLLTTRIDAAPDQIMLTDSGTQAIDLICRFFLEPGDTVLVDDPCYFNFHALLRAHRVRVVGVPYTPQGPDLASFKAALAAHAPRLYLTNSAIHNPTGAVLAPRVAHQLLQLIKRSNLVVVEDDIFADFETTAAPRLAAFDGLSQVICIGSFSKSVSASLRCGYIAARPDWIDSLADLKIATAFGGNRLAAQIVLQVLTGSGYRRHMETVRRRLAEAMQTTLAGLAAVGIQPWHVPQAGMFLWCRLPAGIDAAVLARECLRDGVVLAPGNAFSLASDAQSFCRFNVAQSSDARIFTALARAGAAVRV